MYIIIMTNLNCYGCIYQTRQGMTASFVLKFGHVPSAGQRMFKNLFAPLGLKPGAIIA